MERLVELDALLNLDDKGLSEASENEEQNTHINEQIPERQVPICEKREETIKEPERAEKSVNAKTQMQEGQTDKHEHKRYTLSDLKRIQRESASHRIDGGQQYMSRKEEYSR